MCVSSRPLSSTKALLSHSLLLSIFCSRDSFDRGADLGTGLGAIVPGPANHTNQIKSNLGSDLLCLGKFEVVFAL